MKRLVFFMFAMAFAISAQAAPKAPKKDKEESSSSKEVSIECDKIVRDQIASNTRTTHGAGGAGAKRADAAAVR